MAPETFDSHAAPSCGVHATAIVYQDGPDTWFASCPGIEGAYACAGSRDAALDALRHVLADVVAEGLVPHPPRVDVTMVEA